MIAFACMLGGMGILGGCGGDADGAPSDELAERAWQLYGNLREQADFMAAQGQAAEARQVRRDFADALDEALNEVTDSPDWVRQVLEEIRDGQRRLAEGNVGEAEAAEIQERHDTYMVHLIEGDAPPDYQ